ncbi:MAG: 4Fe-4S dicluster domain-containing protein [Caldisericaceae bacterium]|nr:4Fe-4S dicluster domain-containing protein [Caldisericaceae bacterium]
MPDPKFAKPWHGIPREEIDWHPTVNEEACIGCGTCVTGCGRLGYRFDFARKKSVVYDPLNCLLGCTTCANTCPSNTISFPPLEYVAELLSRPEDMLLFWGVTDTSDFYHLDYLQEWIKKDSNFKIWLAARTNYNRFVPPNGLIFYEGTVYGALKKADVYLTNCDVYLAGPAKTVRATLDVLAEKGVPRDRIFIDSFVR